MDIDGNGMIDLEEFCLCMARHMNKGPGKSPQPGARGQAAGPKKLSSKQLRDAFNYFDKVGGFF